MPNALAQRILQVIDIAPHFIGYRVPITESISRSRNIGNHDHHFATQSQFEMNIQRVDTFLSGSQLQFYDKQHTWYSIALEALVQFDYQLHTRLELVEQFEAETERRTLLTVIEYAPTVGDQLSSSL